MNAATALTERQARFVEEYLVDANGARAAVTAGYGRSGARVAAHRLLTRANVQAALRVRRDADGARLSIARDNALVELQEAAAMAKANCDPMGMIAAWREIGRLCGLYPVHRTAVVVERPKRSLPNPLESMTDVQLQAIINAAAPV